MIVFESIFEFTDILRCVRYKNTISVRLSVFPLPNVLNPEVILHLDCLDSFEEMFLPCLFDQIVVMIIAVVFQRKFVVELVVQLLKLGSIFLLLVLLSMKDSLF